MVWFIFTALFIFLGFAMHKLKWYFLISGYNTMPKEQRANVNVQGLSLLMAKYSYLLALLFALMALFDWFNLENGIPLILIIIVITTFYVILKAQKYNGNVMTPEGKFKKGASKYLKRPILILLLTCIGVASIIYFAVQPTLYSVSETSFDISGMYGDEFAWADVKQLELVDEIPKIAIRTNGSAVGTKKKGHFKFKDGTKATLFVDTSEPPFIKFLADDRVYYLNDKSATKTAALFEQMQHFVEEE